MNTIHNKLSITPSIETLYALDKTPELVDDEKLTQLLCKYSTGFPQTLLNYKKQDPTTYFSHKKHYFFVEEEVKKIAAIANAVVQDGITQHPRYLSRKISNLSVKLVFPSNSQSVLMILRKKDRPISMSTDKNGRSALLVEKIYGIWHSKIVFNLTTKSEKPKKFYAASKQEDLIYHLVPTILPERLYNFLQPTTSNSKKRSCYYSRYQDLSDYGSLNTLSIETACKLALSAAQAVCMVHKQGYLCIDLKTENMLVTEDQKILLCDTDSFIPKNMKGDISMTYTPAIAAPELFTYEINATEMVDVFAFGSILLWIAEHGEPIWCKNHIDAQRLTKDLEPAYIGFAEVGKNHLTGKTPISYRRAILSLAAWTLHPDPKERPTMSLICSYLEKSYTVQDNIAPHDPLMKFWYRI